MLKTLKLKLFASYRTQLVHKKQMEYDKQHCHLIFSKDIFRISEGCYKYLNNPSYVSFKYLIGANNSSEVALVRAHSWDRRSLKPQRNSLAYVTFDLYPHNGKINALMVLQKEIVDLVIHNNSSFGSKLSKGIKNNGMFYLQASPQQITHRQIVFNLQPKYFKQPKGVLAF